MARYLDELGLTTLVRLIAKKLNSVHQVISEALNQQHNKDVELEEHIETLSTDVSNIEQCIEDNELVTASALVDLHEKKLDAKNTITIEEINNIL